MSVQDYPRWIFHPHHPMVLVNSEEEEAALGAGWTRTYPPPLEPEEPAEEKPKPARKRL